MKAGSTLINTPRSRTVHYSEGRDIQSRKIKLEKFKMKKLFSVRRKPQRTESTRLLVENDKSFLQEECDPVINEDDIQSNTSNNNNNEEKPSQIAESLTPQELAEILDVDPDANTSVDGVCHLDRQTSLHLIRGSVRKHFPEQQADLDGNLQEHLANVQNTVHSELERLRPLLDCLGLTECLIDCYHQKTFAHLDDLLQDISSPRSSLVLMDWVVNSYLSPDLLDHPDLQVTLKELDLVLFAEWLVKAKDKLLENSQKGVRAYLENILQSQRAEEGRDRDEAFVSFYVDTIRCIDAVPKETRRISSVLSDQVQEVCFTELLVFLERYAAEQTEALSKEAKKDRPEMWHFFKTLKTCEELKNHVLSKDSTLRRVLLLEILTELDNMETFTLSLQLQIVSDVTEKQLKTYFKTDHNRLLFLISALKTTFPKAHCQEMQTKVLAEAYKLIVQIYLKHLLRSRLRNLQRRWSPDVGKAIFEDAELLHRAMTELAPGVQEGNLMLLEVVEMLECTDVDALKLTVATMAQWQTPSDDVDLLPKLLRWKGLPGWQVREVLDVIPGRRPQQVSCFSWLPCC